MPQVVCCAVGALAFAMVSGCAVNHYAGVDLRAGRAPVEVQALAREARAGDKQAQFALGERYEKGVGTPMDVHRAESLYAAAAAPAGGRQTSFVPRSNGSVSAVSISTGPTVPGVPEAARRLSFLRAEPFAGPEFRVLLARATQAAARRRAFTVYPAPLPAACDPPARANLRSFLDREIRGSVLAVAPACLQPAVVQAELIDLAVHGNIKAQVTGLALVMEYGGCHADRFSARLAAISRSGDGVASVVLGNWHRKCHRLSDASRLYHLAEEQGISAENFYRSVDPALLNVSEGKR